MPPDREFIAAYPEGPAMHVMALLNEGLVRVGLALGINEDGAIRLYRLLREERSR